MAVTVRMSVKEVLQHFQQLEDPRVTVHTLEICSWKTDLDSNTACVAQQCACKR